MSNKIIVSEKNGTKIDISITKHMEGVEDEDDVEAGDLEGSPAEEAGSMYTLMDQDMVRDWWDEIWQRRSKDNTFLSEFDPMPYNYDTTTFIGKNFLISKFLKQWNICFFLPGANHEFLSHMSGQSKYEKPWKITSSFF